MSKLSLLSSKKEAKTAFILLILNIIVTFILVLLCANSKSMALSAFTYLTIFDILSLCTVILNSWVKLHESTSSFSYGYKRFEVLAVFSCVILSILGAFFTVKECVEAFFEPKEVHTGRFVPAAFLAFIIHMIVTLVPRNESFNYVIQASGSSWLQEHVTDLCETICRVIPSLSKILLPRINPFSLLGFACLTTLLVTYSLLQVGYSYLADLQAAIFISIMIFGTMLPMALYTGKILLQTTPSHILGQLDKCLREASTFDGVLEFRDEHFWSLSFGTVVGSLHVRVRRDADEQLVLAHVWNKLAGLVQILTIHIFKDDWIRRTTHQLVYNSSQNLNRFSPNPHASAASPTPYQTPFNPLQQQQQQQQIQSPIQNNQSTTIVNPLLANSRRVPNTALVDNEYVIINP